LSQPQSPQWDPPSRSPRKQGLGTRAIVAIVIGVVVVVILVGAVIAGAFLAGIQQSNNNIRAPTVTKTDPPYGSTGVAVNALVVVTFSNPMDLNTITNSTITLRHQATPNPGSVRFFGVTAIFAPSAALECDTVYTATVTTGVKDTSGRAPVVDYVWSFTTDLCPSLPPPSVIGTSPVLGVSIDSNINATFSKIMDPTTITTSTFIITHGSTPIPGTVTYTGTTASFKPSNNLATNTTYTATITTGARDLLGVALAANNVWSFKTVESTTTTGPYVTHTNPLYSATGVGINTKLLVTFSEAMDPTTINTSTITLQHGATSTSGAVSYTGLTATLTPSANLLSNTVYTATVTTGVKDTSGNALGVNYVWPFTTAGIVDTTPPIVIGTSPTSGVPVNSTISVTFSKAMDPTTITATSFTLAQGTTPVQGTVTYAGTTASFKPASDLAPNTAYTATITTAVTDLAGNHLQNAFKWTFTTSTTNGCSQAPVNLATAANFAILSSASVSNTGKSNVTGDVGVSPGTAISGFPPGTVYGTIWKNNNVTAQTAQADALTAYNDATARTQCVITISGNIGGQILLPGLYWSQSTLEISSGNLTLDAQGNANAVWIFQIRTAFTISPGLKIILANGAQAKNIFWVIGSSATLDAASVFYGTILATTSINVATGATLNGRALTLVGSVTLDSATITKPILPG
jgi:hypothetical protein